MLQKGNIKILAILAYAVILLSCTDSDISELPQQEALSSSSAGNAAAQNYCVYPPSADYPAGLCFPGSFADCPSDGILALNCPYSSSSAGSDLSVSSSSAGSADNGSSSSSSEALQEYAWCIFSQDRTCLPGPASVCPPGGTLGNACPYSSSSISSGRSSSGADISVNVFTDPRDGKKYKCELGPDGRVWMSENLNFSDGNTLGWCYEGGVKTLGEPGADGEGCNSPYGRTYNQITAMDVCPPDWHLPSRDEWDAIKGVRIMPRDFYVSAGNYDDLNGWKERCNGFSNCNGFYWTSQPTIFRMMFVDGDNLVISSPDGNASATDDYFSVRCIMDATAGNTGNCNGVPFNPLVQLCIDGTVYSTVLLGKQIWINEDFEFNGASEYDWATAMNLPSTCNNTSCASEINVPHQGICPEGWHLPNRNEIPQPFNYFTVLWTAEESSQWPQGAYRKYGSSIASDVSKTSLNPVRCVKD